jgi:hypothetical protein
MQEFINEGKMNNRISEDEIIRVNIHKSLLEEFRIRKELYEKKIGYKITGGTPIISQICAKMLEQERTGKRDKIVIEVHKIKGLKSVETFLL